VSKSKSGFRRPLPRDARALAGLAERAAAAGRPLEAADLLQRAVAYSPNVVDVRHQCAVFLLNVDRATDALPHLEWLHAKDPANPRIAFQLATACARIGDYQRAATFYPPLLRQAPSDARLWLAYASALRHSDRRAEAAAACRRVIALAPETGAAYQALLEIAGAELSSEEQALLEQQLGRASLPAKARASLHYAFGRLMEQRGDYAAGFHHYAQAAACRRGTIDYDPAVFTDLVDRLIALFTPDFLAARAELGHNDPASIFPAPIFIVGMPRAGSTLIEQILASHSQVEGTMELPELAHVVRVFVECVAGGDAARFPECIAAATPADLAAHGKLYIERLRPYRRLGRPYVTDKMPFSWVHAGLIHLILPGAKIIDARRHPMAACFSAFRQDFATGQRFSYDLRELAQYYRDYARLMDHFDRVLPGRIHRVQYERMVADMEGEVRRLLAYCGLEFEPACLRFWTTERAVSTASSEQVRRPLYSDSVAAWRHFEPWLGELKEGLRGLLPEEGKKAVLF
jgi:tetratricopeptide (TPR) repeat protein